jgi:hypothetical protein
VRKPSPADIVCFKRYSLFGFHVKGERRFLAREYMPKGYPRLRTRPFESFPVTDGHPRSTDRPARFRVSSTSSIRLSPALPLSRFPPLSDLLERGSSVERPPGRSISRRPVGWGASVGSAALCGEVADAFATLPVHPRPRSIPLVDCAQCKLD